LELAAERRAAVELAVKADLPSISARGVREFTGWEEGYVVAKRIRRVQPFTRTVGRLFGRART
jgi:hypothetical protein